MDVIKNMKVVDLKNELGKRGLSKVGLKAELVSRLVEAIQKEQTINDENSPPNVQKPNLNLISKKTMVAPEKLDNQSDSDHIDHEKPAAKRARKAPTRTGKSKSKIQKKEEELYELLEGDNQDVQEVPQDKEDVDSNSARRARVPEEQSKVVNTAVVDMVSKAVSPSPIGTAAPVDTPKVESSFTEVFKKVEEVRKSNPEVTKLSDAPKKSDETLKVPIAKETSGDVNTSLPVSYGSTGNPEESKDSRKLEVSKKDSSKSAFDFAKYINQVLFDTAVLTVCKQVNPSITVATSGLKIIKTYLIHIVDKVLKVAVKIDNGKRVVTLASMEQAVNYVYRNELAKHALQEGHKAVQRFRQTKDIEDGELQDYLFSANVAGLVFPIHLFQPLILNGRYVSDQKSLPDEALVFLSAATEYFTAELLEIAINHTTHHNHRETNLNAHHIKEALPSDEELSHLLSQYSVSSDIQKAWKSKVHEILDFFSKLPPEEFCEISKYLTDKMAICDATYSTREILEAFAQEVASEQLSNEIRSLSSLVTIQEVQCVEQELGNSFFPRTKSVIFTIPVPKSTERLTFFYSSRTYDIQYGTDSEMSVAGQLEGVLWKSDLDMSSNEPPKRKIGTALLEQLRDTLGLSTVTVKDLVRFLLSIGEAESGGGMSIIQSELEEMEYNGMFADQLANSLNGTSTSMEMESSTLLS